MHFYQINLFNKKVFSRFLPYPANPSDKKTAKRIAVDFFTNLKIKKTAFPFSF